MFSLLWLNFIRVLLYYAEEATSMSQGGNAHSPGTLQQSVHDNIQRTMDFFVSENILIRSDECDSPRSQANASLDVEKHKLYMTTCEVIGQYWQQPANELKVSNIFEPA